MESKSKEERIRELLDAGMVLDIHECIRFLIEALEIKEYYRNLTADSWDEQMRQTNQIANANLLLALLSAGYTNNLLNND